MCFLNQAYPIDLVTSWNEPSYQKLWLYNLHYFDDLNSDQAHERTAWHYALIQRWINENPVEQGNGWEPYPLSLRVVNWLKWALSGHVLSTEMQHSLILQTRYLMKRIEWHLLGNHLLANAKALVFAGLFFEGLEAKLWFNTGMGILAKQLPEQILSDGGHFELSPMYHGIILEDILDLVNVCHCYDFPIPTHWSIIVTQMFAWLQAMTHPDEQIAFFNDATFGIAPSLKELTEYATKLSIMVPKAIKRGLQHLAASGYCRVQMNSAVLMADVAAVGPDYLPGHAHADSLSYEFSLNDQRIFVNSGTSTYENNVLRAQQRATAAHNTLVIDDENSSEVWGAFRVARRAKVFNIKTQVEDHALSLSASHNGYARLAGKPIHVRKWRLTAQSLRIEDSVTSDTVHTGKIYFHFHPSILLIRVDSQTCLVCDSDAKQIATFSASEIFSIESGFFYSAFNQAIASQYLVIEQQNIAAVQVITELKWN